VDFQRLLEQGDMSQNIYLQPDDFVYVPSGAAREVYLFGAVRNPRAMALSETPPWCPPSPPVAAQCAMPTSRK
jgi:protein involved in polysaccharide export with SLBB domain